jgi:hypothetical protein
MTTRADNRLQATGAALADGIKAFDASLPPEVRSRQLQSVLNDHRDAMAAEVDARNQVKVASREKRRASKAVREHIKRVHSTVIGIFGDDSAEYASAGGKPRSTRKRPVRKSRKGASAPSSAPAPPAKSAA